MTWGNWDRAYSKIERSSLDRFKNRNRLLKSFGQDAIAVYAQLDGTLSSKEIQDAVGLSADSFAAIMEFMVQNGMVSEAGESSESKPEPAVQNPDSSSPYSRAPASRPPSARIPPPSENIEPAYRSVSSASSSAPRQPAYTPPASSLRSSSRTTTIQPPPDPPPDSPDDDSDSSGPSHGSDAIPSAEESLSPLERIIFEKYGQVGVKVYNLIDGERTAEDILHETGLSETKLVEILEFMNEQGIIKLERPARPPPSTAGGAPAYPLPGGFTPPGTRAPPYPPPPGTSPYSPPNPNSPRQSRASDDGVGFKPMVEAGGENPPASDSQVELISPDAVPVDVPVLPPRVSILQRAQMAGTLSMKFGKVGHDLLAHVDGVKDFVDIAVETGLAFEDLDIILGELGKSGLLSFKPLNRIEIRHRYGDDGLAVYKRYGRDGLLVYQMIGKATSLREIAQKSKMDPDRLVDVLIFVHRVLGLDLPLDRDTIFRYIQGKK